MTSAAASAHAPEPHRLTVVPPVTAEAAKLADLEDRITSLAGQLAAATAQFLRLLSEFDAAGGWQAHGLRSCAQWLSWKCGMSSGAAREHVRVAQSIVSLPAVQQAFSAGRLSFSKVRAITRVATPDTEAELVETAQACTASQLDRLCSGIKTVRTNEEVLTHRSRARFTATWRDDGMLSFSGRLAPEDGATLLAALAALKVEPVRDGARAAGGINGAPDDLPDDRYRDAAMLAARADAEALVMLARHSLENPPEAAVSEPARLIVHAHAPVESVPAGGVPAEGATAEGVTAEGAPAENVPAGTFSGGGVLDAGPAMPLLPLSPETLERLACSAVVEAEEDPDGKRVGDVPTKSRNRFADRKQRRALMRRDGGCRFAGCTRKRGLHAHHVVHYAKGGLTVMANLVLLCDHHHLLVHEGGWRLDRCGQSWVAVSPSGQRHDDAPPLRGDVDGVSTAFGADIRPESVTGSWAGDPLRLADAVGTFAERLLNRARPTERPEVG